VRTKVFRSGNSQAVRIPREFQLDVSEVEILRNGDDLILRKPPGSLVRAFELLTSLSSDFFEGGRKQPKMDRRTSMDCAKRV
jgi:antitoxin VapB